MITRVSEYWGKTNRWHRIIFAFTILYLGVIPSNRQGFYCNDPKLSHEYTGDTISWKVLLLITAFQPLLIMLIFEKLYNSGKSDGGHRQNYFLKWYKEYFYSLVLNLIIVHLLKILVGEPRPHFFHTCQPEEASSCKSSEYVATYTCTHSHWLSESARSFPSGHSSLGVHCALFIAWYLQVRIAKVTVKRTTVVLLAQSACAMLGVFCAVSRIYDNRHHWWDVLTGAVIAVALVYYTVIKLCNNFECPDSTVKEANAADDVILEHKSIDSTVCL